MQTRTQTDIWTYPDASWSATDLRGFDVQAIDGGIGAVDETMHEAGAGHLIVDTGPWIFGKKVMLPAGVISHVDVEGRTVSVNLTKDQVKRAPEFDETRYRESAYRDELGTYYGGARRDDRPL